MTFPDILTRTRDKPLSKYPKPALTVCPMSFEPFEGDSELLNASICAIKILNVKACPGEEAPKCDTFDPSEIVDNFQHL